MAPSTYTILITGMGASTAQSVAKAFRSQNELSVRLVGVDIFLPHLSSASRFCDTLHVVPPVSQRDSYEQRLLQIVRLERADLIVPILDPELLYFAEARELFEAAGARLVMGSLATHRICGSKFETAKHLRAEGLPFAQTLPMSEASNLPFPMILKPDDRVSSSHVYRVDDEDELRVLGRRVPNPIVQPYISGNEFTIDVPRVAATELGSPCAGFADFQACHGAHTQVITKNVTAVLEAVERKDSDRTSTKGSRKAQARPRAAPVPPKR